MKKFLLSFFCILAMPMMLTASNLTDGDLPLPLLPKIDPTEPNDPNQKSPIVVPVFYLDGHTLTASDNTIGSTVELLDENDNVVFSTYIYIEGDIQLPTTLAGTYTIEVTRAGQTFIGEIELYRLGFPDGIDIFIYF